MGARKKGLPLPRNIIDAHCHIFPDKLVDKATASIGRFYDLPMQENGSADALARSAREAGIGRCLVCSTATRAAQVGSINDFIAEAVGVHPALFVGLGTLHQEMNEAEIEAELDRMEELGLKGVKLHPDFQQFPIDDASLFPLYRAIARRKLPVLFHTGDKRFPYSNPARLARVNDAIPGLIAIAAHFGGYSEWDEASETLAGRENIYFDTSSSLAFLPPDQARGLISLFGADRMMFGSDFPMWRQKDEIARFEALGLPVAEEEAIFHGNFERLFGL